MPISEDFQPVPMIGNVISVPMPDDKAFITVQIQRNTATDAEMDTILQELIDLLQTWPGKREDGNVMGQRYLTGYYNAGPTTPVVDNTPPPEDPPGNGGPQPAP